MQKYGKPQNSALRVFGKNFPPQSMREMLPSSCTSLWDKSAPYEKVTRYIELSLGCQPRALLHRDRKSESPKSRPNPKPSNPHEVPSLCTALTIPATKSLYRRRMRLKARQRGSQLNYPPPKFPRHHSHWLDLRQHSPLREIAKELPQVWKIVQRKYPNHSKGQATVKDL